MLIRAYKTKLLDVLNQKMFYEKYFILYFNFNFFNFVRCADHLFLSFHINEKRLSKIL